MSLLVDGVVEFFFGGIEVLFLGVLIHRELGFFDDAAGVGIFHEAHELLVAWLRELEFEEGAAGFFGFAVVELLLGLGGELGSRVRFAF